MKMGGLNVGVTCAHSSLLPSYCASSALDSAVILGMIAALLNLTIIAFDHFLLIVKPMKHGIWLSKDSKASNIVPLLVWGVSLLLASSKWIISLAAGTGPLQGRLCKTSLLMLGILIDGIMSVLLTLICITAMVVCYTFINIHMRNIRGPSVRLPGTQRNNRKLLITSLLLLGTFLLCWGPFLCFIVAGVIMPLFGFARQWLLEMVAEAHGFFLLTFTVNTVCDPLIYAIRIERVRDGYIQMWVRLTGCQSEDSASRSRCTRTARVSTEENAV